MTDKPKQLNLQGLLRFALESTKTEDASYGSAYEQMDDERKIFLESAIKAMTIDVIEEFEKAIGFLTVPSATPLEKMNALNVIREYIDDINFANNFIKVGGGDVILNQLKTNDYQIRTISAYIVAEMSQNNPVCQTYFVESKIIPLLISYLNNNEDNASSALHAISSLIRNFEPGLIEFLQHGGINALISCLNTTHPRLFIKTCFLIATLSSEHSIRDSFVKKSVVTMLSTNLEPTSGFDIKIETVLFALAELSKSSEWNIEGQEHFNVILNNIIAANEQEPECEVKKCINSFVKKSVVTMLSTNLEPTSGFDIKIETVLFALAELSKSSEWNIEGQEHFNVILNNIIAANEQEPECEEMITYARLILENTKSNIHRQ